MHRFFLTDRPMAPGQVVDMAPLAHQLRHVLRMRPGQQVLLLDGQGHAYPTEIRQLDQDGASGLVLGRETVNTEPGLRLTLYQCSLKADRFEWVLQKGTELGIARFVPVISQHSVMRPAAKLLRKYPRWRAIMREAAEQCGRGQLPQLVPPLTWQEAVLQAEGLRLLPWEESALQPMPSVFSFYREGARDAKVSLLFPLRSLRLDGESSSLEQAGPVVQRCVSLLIGPEGGLAGEEVAEAAAAGWQVVTLGPRILRAETAALAAATMVLYQAGELGPKQS